MARRPADVDPKAWLAERDRIWRRRHRVLNLLMLAAIALIVARSCL